MKLSYAEAVEYQNASNQIGLWYPVDWSESGAEKYRQLWVEMTGNPVHWVDEKHLGVAFFEATSGEDAGVYRVDFSARDGSIFTARFERDDFLWEFDPAEEGDGVESVLWR